jgi:hypothetical protein
MRVLDSLVGYSQILMQPSTGIRALPGRIPELDGGMDSSMNSPMPESG